MPKFTKRLVESIKPDPTKIEKVWDSEIKGFGLIILPSGRKTYCVEYRNENRRKKRLKIGGRCCVNSPNFSSRSYFSL